MLAVGVMDEFSDAILELRRIQHNWVYVIRRLFRGYRRLFESDLHENSSITAKDGRGLVSGLTATAIAQAGGIAAFSSFLKDRNGLLAIIFAGVEVLNLIILIFCVLRMAEAADPPIANEPTWYRRHFFDRNTVALGRINLVAIPIFAISIGYLIAVGSFSPSDRKALDVSELQFSLPLPITLQHNTPSLAGGLVDTSQDRFSALLPEFMDGPGSRFIVLSEYFGANYQAFQLSLVPDPHLRDAEVKYAFLVRDVIAGGRNWEQVRVAKFGIEDDGKGARRDPRHLYFPPPDIGERILLVFTTKEDLSAESPDTMRWRLRLENKHAPSQ